MSKEWEWSEEQQQSFEKVVHELSSGRELVPLEDEAALILYTDASSVGVGAVLMQRDKSGKERPILFVSKKLSPVQSRWTTGEQEAYGVITA
ncbi:retrovirus-related Pol polyprotein from transposon 17.6, partial [Aduncisulcus paluster]